MTQQEQNTIVAAVIESLKTNSKTIQQLTEVAQVPNDGYVEISGGRKISLSTIISAVASSVQTNILASALSTMNSSIAGISAKVTQSVEYNALDTVLGANTSAMIATLSTAANTRYNITQSSKIVGVMDVFMDQQSHCITEVVKTNCTLTANGDFSTHDHKEHTFVRFYNCSHSAATLPSGASWPVGTWSAWQEPLADLEDSVEAIAAAAVAVETAARTSADTAMQATITTMSSLVTALQTLTSSLNTDKLDKSSVKTTTGTSTTDVMSQKTVTDALSALQTAITTAASGKVNTSDIEQSTGTSTTKVMSQNAVKTALDSLNSTITASITTLQALITTNAGDIDELEEYVKQNVQTARFDAIIPSGTFIAETESTTQLTGEYEVHFDTTSGKFYAKNGNVYTKYFDRYAEFCRGVDGSQDYDTASKNRLYICGDALYTYNGSALAKLGATDLAALATSISTLGTSVSTNATEIANNKALLNNTIINVNVLLNSNLAYASLTAAVQAVIAGVSGYTFKKGVQLVYLTTDGWQQKLYNGANDNTAAQVEDNWKDITGGSVGNIYNITNERPIQGYYKLSDVNNTSASVVHVSWDQKKAKAGLIISFEISEGVWKTYQYVGRTVTELNWKNQDNWEDFGSLPNGSQTYIVIEEIVGAPASGYYTLESAVTALIAYQQSSGIIYAKSGLIISYKSGENTRETKMFCGTVTDFSAYALWKDFGGGTEVETSDTPEEDGEDAFSTGGAYDLIPAGLSVDTETEGVVKISLVNAGGDTIGDEEQFSVGTGGGGGSSTGTVITTSFQTSPIYVNAGASAIAYASIRSVTTQGQSTVTNNIEKVELYDRDTNGLLQTFNVNQASSASGSNYSFSFNLTEYAAVAGTRRLKFVVTDDGGNTGTRNLNLTAVDVTISSVQTLHYTEATVLTVGGGVKSIPMYKFANRQSNITAHTEIYLNGSWQSLGTASITDSYSHSISINPASVLGSALTHGVYQIRIHGVDDASGVVGNYLYTSIMVINSESTTPLVATRYFTAAASGSVKLYESVNVEYAVYDPQSNNPTAKIYVDNVLNTSRTCYRNETYSYTKQVVNKATDGTQNITIKVQTGAVDSSNIVYTVNGSVIAAAIKAGSIYGFDFSNRSNAEADHSIVSGDYSIVLTGANYSTTGFGTFNGENCMRVAENVTGVLNHAPFASDSLESNGFGIQFAFAAKNCINEDTKLIECFHQGTGAGFYVTGKCVGIYCENSTTGKVEERRYKNGEKITVAVVCEPAVEGLGKTRSNTTYYFLKLYLNGEEVAVIGYTAGENNLKQMKNISFNGADGDLYLFYMMAWNDYFQFDQAFQNYLVKLTDVDAMTTEFNFENVMASQQVVEYDVNTTKSRPQANLMHAGGMPYIIECPNSGSDIEILDHTTSTDDKINVNLFYYDPARPWRSFKATKVQRKNQGTTSTLRPVKNPRYYLGKATKLEPLYPDYTNDEAVLCYKLFKMNSVLIGENNIPVQTITVKVDYSDSGGANDCGVCDMMNAAFRAAGSLHMTPAQRAYNGTWSGTYTESGTSHTVNMTGLMMNHSTANHPVALFRSKSESGSSPYFHAKGNWKMDKKEEVALGFKKTPGYNKGCLNWGDFVAYYGTSSETLAQIKTRFLADDNVDTSKVYGLLLYCGRDFKVMRYQSGAWTETTGSMQQVSGVWTITGDVINPVEGFELLQYEGMDWFMGVASVSDLMEATSNQSKWVKKLVDAGDVAAQTYPAWTQYFEQLIDNDDLAVDYAMGRRVPYNLLQWMIFCNSCDYSQAQEGDNTYKNNWKNNLWKHASVRSCHDYGLFTDYLAAIDQQAKNMQPMWFLEDGHCIINGVYDPSGSVASDLASQDPMIMYLNKVYDADGVNSKDNDGGCTVDAETDPNKDSVQGGFTNPYAGHGSILFKMMYIQPENVINAAGDTLTVKNSAAAFRSAQITEDGLTFKPFSPEGATYYFLTKRLRRWPKKVSAYDGERKYLDFTATADSIYFYALQGLGLTALPDFIERRWRFRDGYYQTGNFFSGILSGRIAAANGATITIKAAKSGYFGIGNDSAGSLTESVYLEAGSSHTFTTFSHETGALLYIYQADRMSELDLSGISLSNTFDFSICTLLRKLKLGSDTHTDITIGSYAPLTSTSLGELPFLEELDIRKTAITNVICTSCPRLATIKAENSQLKRIDIADGANVTSMTLPATYEYLRLRYLPNLTNNGITLASPGSVKTLIVEDCANLDEMALLRSLIASTTQLQNVRVKTVATTGNGADLTTLAGLNLKGYDDTLTQVNYPVIVGEYDLTSFYEPSAVTEFNTAFPNLTVRNVQYTGIEFTDTEDDPENIKNLDNNTGYGCTDAFAPSGHISKIWQAMKAVKAVYNQTTHKMEVKALSDATYLQFADGTEFKPDDPLGESYDVMLRTGHFWYKGVNDYVHEKKYIFFSSEATTPRASGTYSRKTLSQILYQEHKGVNVNSFTVGNDYSDASLATASTLNVYKMNVSGMSQVRFPGMNIANYGAIFVGADGKVKGKFNLANSGSMFDFTDGNYVFMNVPAGSAYVLFSGYGTFDSTLECIATTATSVEAIEPDWVEHKDNELIGVYQLSVDNMNQARSISGVTPKRGNGTSTTNAGWTYDANGKLTNTVVPTPLNYTMKDLSNICAMRGQGFQLADYEMNKIMAIMFYALTGTRYDQQIIGNGTVNSLTGTLNSIGKANSQSASGVNKLLGLEGYIACYSEWEDNIAFNVQSYKNFYKNKCVAVNGVDTADYKFRIYDPITDTERAVKIPNTGSGTNVARVHNGRMCDILPSKFLTSDTSRFVTYYTAGVYFDGSTGRVVYRSYNYGNAGGGLVYASANNASSFSSTYDGGRLAFRGEIVEATESEE